MSSYKIIGDEDLFNEFVEWLPDPEPDEGFYACLFSRKKYADPEEKHPNIKSDEGQLKRLVVRKKEFLYNKIWQLEAPIGSYVYMSGEPVKQKSLAMYINPNPRNLRKTLMQGIKRFLDVIENPQQNIKPDQEIVSIIQNTASKTKSIMFDIDDPDVSLQQLIDISDGLCDIIKTRGGYHVHVIDALKSGIRDKGWYLSYKELADKQGKTDNMTPVVGCYQGGHIPYFAYRYNK